MTTKIFFDNAKNAEKISENLGEPINDDELSIKVDPEELQLALKQTNIKSGYSIAVISNPDD